MTTFHTWELKGGTTAGSSPITLWQCRDCGRSASRLSTSPSTTGIRLAEPEIDDPCDGKLGGL